MRLIFVRLEGGLGNQLFQYAFAVALQAEIGGRIILDRRLLQGDEEKISALGKVVELPPQRALDSVLCWILRVYAGGMIRLASTVFGRNFQAEDFLSTFGVFHAFGTRFRRPDLPKWSPFLYLHGNWMSERYFEGATDAVRRAFGVAFPLSRKGAEVAAHIEAVNAVAVHVRRGDYLSERWRGKLHVCSDEYYSRAVETILKCEKDPVFFVFSNGPEDNEWIKENYRFLPEGTVFVGHGTSDVEHFVLMAMCRSFVIANSTFSWWASFLARPRGGAVVAPSPWNRSAWDMTDIYSVDWKIIQLDLGSEMGR